MARTRLVRLRHILWEVPMPDFGVEQARRRALEAMQAGKWETVPAQLDAYGAAVRAEERFLVLADALAALQDCGGKDGSRAVGECLDAVRRLQ
jgi:hypothetical protein